MSGMDIFVAFAIYAQREQRAFEEKMRGLPPEMANRLRMERAERKERERKEAETERRHREMCDAIRSTSFWRFGS